MEQDILKIKQCLKIKNKNPRFFNLLEKYLSVNPDADEELLIDEFLDNKGNPKSEAELKPLMVPVYEILEARKDPAYKLRIFEIQRKREEEERKFLEKQKKREEKLEENRKKARERARLKKEKEKQEKEQKKSKSPGPVKKERKPRKK
jgi:type I site-specific restriction-modification system R (restriction) subunit